MKCRKCRLREANSLEHVILSALGGRWEVPGVLCKPCNDVCGAGIDADLAQGFLSMRVLLGIRGDRGQVPTMETVDEHGQRVIVDAGMVPRAPEGPPQVIEEKGNRKTVGGFASERAARQYVESHKRKGINFEVTAASIRSTYPGAVRMDVGFQGGEGGWRSCVKTILTFMAGAGTEGQPDVLGNAWRYVSGEPFERYGVLIAFSATPPPVSGEALGLGLVSHRVAVRSNPDRGFVEADLRFFGDFGVCVRIDAPNVPNCCLGYGVDPLTGKSCRFDGWSGAIGIPGAADFDHLCGVLTEAVTKTLAFAQVRNTERSVDELVESAVKEAFADVPHDQPSPEAIRTLAQLVTERVIGRVLREPSERPAPELVEKLK